MPEPGSAGQRVPHYIKESQYQIKEGIEIMEHFFYEEMEHETGSYAVVQFDRFSYGLVDRGLVDDLHDIDGNILHKTYITADDARTAAIQWFHSIEQGYEPIELRILSHIGCDPQIEDIMIQDMYGLAHPTH